MNEIDQVQTMCYTYFPKTKSPIHKWLYTKSYYDVLQSLPLFDGLRLATAQLLIADNSESGMDLLRLSNNIIRLQEWSAGTTTRRTTTAATNGATGSTSNNSLLTVSMTMMTNNNNATTTTMEEGVTDIVDFLFRDRMVNSTARIKMAKYIGYKMSNDYKRKKESKTNNHFTEGKLTLDERHGIKKRLENDPILGPILLKLRKIVERGLLS